MKYSPNPALNALLLQNVAYDHSMNRKFEISNIVSGLVIGFLSIGLYSYFSQIATAGQSSNILGVTSTYQGATIPRLPAAYPSYFPTQPYENGVPCATFRSFIANYCEPNATPSTYPIPTNTLKTTEFPRPSSVLRPTLIKLPPIRPTVHP